TKSLEIECSFFWYNIQNNKLMKLIFLEFYLSIEDRDLTMLLLGNINNKKIYYVFRQKIDSAPRFIANTLLLNKFQNKLLHTLLDKQPIIYKTIPKKLDDYVYIQIPR